MEFENKTVLITGAGSGLGRLSALAFAKRGAKAALFDVNKETLEETREQIVQAGGTALTFPVDVRRYDEIRAAVVEIVQKFGSVDVLINLAGGAETRLCKKSGKFWEIPIEVYDFGIDLNLKGQFYCAHAVMPYMAAQKSGVILNIGSVTGAEGCDTNVAYSASKSGVMEGLTKSLALAGAPYGIRCCCVSPGPVLTRAAMSKMKTAIGRAAEPEEIVDFLLYLASDKAAFITGSNHLIDGGRVIARDRT